MKRIIKYSSGFHSIDETPSSIFPSNTASFPLSSWQPYKAFENICSADTLQITEFSPYEKEMTSKLRSMSKRAGCLLPMEKMHDKPMYSKIDAMKVMLPLDNKKDCDFLTYRSSYDFTLGLANAIFKANPSDDIADALSMWFIDPSICIPYANIIRQDGKMCVSEKEWKQTSVDMFSHVISQYLRRDILSTPLDTILPPINPTKSPGFNNHFVDGSEFNRKDFWIHPGMQFSVPKEYNPNDTWFRFDSQPIKDDYVNSGKLLANVKELLSANLDNPEDVVKCFMDECLPTHVVAYRGNNFDHLSSSFIEAAVKEHALDGFMTKGRHKDRIMVREIEGYKYQSGVCSDDKLMNFVHQQSSNDRFKVQYDSARIRVMYPVNVASVMLAFILLGRMVMHCVEDGASGFPSTRSNVLDRYSRVYNKFDQSDFHIITMDRTNSEQFISDNLEKALQLLPVWLRRIVKCSMTVVLPSYGPRITRGLCSGTAMTTMMNSIVGLFESINLITEYTGGSFDDVCPKYLSMIFNQEDYIEVNGYYICSNLGTDDQIQLVWSSKKVSVAPEWASDRSIKLETPTTATVFGLDFDKNGVRVSQTLGLSKLWLCEKARNGDEIACKYTKRLEMLPDFYEIIKKFFLDNGYGDIDGYKSGCENYLQKAIPSFGLGDFNLYNPSDVIMTSNLLDKKMPGYDPSRDKHYTEEQMSPIYKFWLHELSLSE